ncbi:ABC transporter ATP-binding protein [Pseudomonas viridiflava]|uniref:ABC transporter ATP-binding protein n=1 Tax=Pseudomonas viridiflava TaxID=33069 RepID=UPI000F045105|nr:ABC transporter ATP-binding protein [Pseudomonas viridiflava]
MFKLIKELISLLTPQQRRRLLRLQFLVVIMSFAEIAGIASIAPFMAIVSDMSRLEGTGKLAQIYAASGFSTPADFLFWLGLAVLLVLVCGGVFSMLTTWRLLVYGQAVGEQISSRLFRYYLGQPWLFHATNSSSLLNKQITQEASRVTLGIIQPLMQLNAKMVLASLMSLAIFVYNPIIAIAGLLIFGLAYAALYRFVRLRLVRNGKEISVVQSERFKLIGEGFGGIKDVLLLGRQALYQDRFEKANRRYTRSMAGNQAMSQVPRYAMELVAFGSVIMLVLYLLKVNAGNFADVVPVLAVYALAGMKLLPAFQQMYSSLSQIKGSMASFESIKKPLRESYAQAAAAESGQVTEVHSSRLILKDGIRIQDVTFSYPEKSSPALNQLRMEIPARKVIGLVGSSGSGKSTAIDLILGLIAPDQGALVVDGIEIGSANLRTWQNSVGFVPQSIFLTDSSIRENIAFGLAPEQIDESKVQRAVSLAHLEELIASLPEGLSTCVGERGVQLSGGQRQRIGIARALYEDADILVLDEATSALDGITEKLIMDAIHDFSGQKTIIMIAHRLTTVRQCDVIYFMSEGKVSDQGTYDDLIERNEAFRRMAVHA